MGFNYGVVQNQTNSGVPIQIVLRLITSTPWHATSDSLQKDLIMEQSTTLLPNTTQKYTPNYPYRDSISPKAAKLFLSSKKTLVSEY